MFKINRKIEYALISLKHMSTTQPGQLTSAKDICDVYKTPFDPTARGLQIMAQNGLLRAAHGAHGGYEITKDLSKMTFLELVEMIAGPIQIANCFNHDYPNCEIKACCNIISPMLNLNEQMAKFFKTVSIQDLIGSRASIIEKNIRQNISNGVKAK